MDFWRRSARGSRREKIRNEIIKDRMNVKNSIVDFIKTKNHNGLDTRKEWQSKDCQGELSNGPHQEEGKEEDHLSPG